jgi:ribosomal protein S18 acetylase RimI-like enzyme
MFQIRPYGDDDLETLVELWYRSWTNNLPNLKHPIPFKHWTHRFQSELVQRGEIWVAQQQVKIVGFLMIIKSDQWLDQLFVDVDFQGQGVGAILLNHAKTLSPTGLRLTTLQQNTKACRFYEHHGFTAVKLGVNALNKQPNIEYRWSP